MTRARASVRAAQTAPHVRRTLRQVFGLDALRPGQDDVIASVLDGRDTLAIMPTGSGKSLCYQLPACSSQGIDARGFTADLADEGSAR